MVQNQGDGHRHEQVFRHDQHIQVRQAEDKVCHQEQQQPGIERLQDLQHPPFFGQNSYGKLQQRQVERVERKIGDQPHQTRFLAYQQQNFRIGQHPDPGQQDVGAQTVNAAVKIAEMLALHTVGRQQAGNAPVPAQTR